MPENFASLKRVREGDEDSSYSSDLPRPAHKRSKSQQDRQNSHLEPKNIQYKDLKTYLYDELQNKKIGEKDKKIILPDDVKAVWAPRYVHRFYTSQEWYDLAWDEDCTMDAYFQIMSILICINYDTEKWKNFKQDFIDENRNDKCLPFKPEELWNFIGKIDGNLFYDHQSTFCPPLVIEEREDPYCVEGKKRLPWLGESKVIGEGAYGLVKQHTIAAGYLVYSNRGANTNPIAVAVKTVEKANVHVKEFANLKELRGCLSDHKHIMVNIATIVETSDYRKYHLLYELAAYDLGVFLTTPRLEVRSKRRGSARQNRNGSSDVQAADLIEAISNLADALDYIHNRLYTREGRIALAHNDIKPDNILVVYPDSTDPSHVFPAGKWKLTDFGLSRIKERKCNEQRLGANDAIQRPDMTQMTHRLQSSVSKTQPKRDPGNYTAPELEQNRDQPQKVDGRKADIWSFGCVLADVIAYAVQMDNSLVSDLHLTAGIRYYTNDGKKIKPDILEFFKQLPEKAPEWARELNSHAWIRSCTDLVEKILDMKPTERPGANKIRDGLRDIRGDAKAYEGPWTDVGEHRSASPEPTNPMHLDGHNCGARRAAEDTAQPPQIIVSPVGHSASFQNGRRSERTRDDFEL